MAIHDSFFSFAQHPDTKKLHRESFFENLKAIAEKSAQATSGKLTLQVGERISRQDADNEFSPLR